MYDKIVQRSHAAYWYHTYLLEYTHTVNTVITVKNGFEKTHKKSFRNNLIILKAFQIRFRKKQKSRVTEYFPPHSLHSPSLTLLDDKKMKEYLCSKRPCRFDLMRNKPIEWCEGTSTDMSIVDQPPPPLNRQVCL